MAWGSIVVACVAAVGALVAWRYLPARAPAVVSSSEQVPRRAERGHPEGAAAP
jgi:hypothetical protein